MQKIFSFFLVLILSTSIVPPIFTPVGVISLSTSLATIPAEENSPLHQSAVLVSAGWANTCALTVNGGVQCWGNNYSGQLGDGTTTNRTTPVDVVGLTSGISAISVGTGYACALTMIGGVKCWGDNWKGKLGDGTTTSRSTPVDVVGLTNGVLAVYAGSYHTCALTTAGGVKCWGSNEDSQLGDGTNTNRSTPVDVTGLASGISHVAPGYAHTCAVTAAEGVKCWGKNSSGQLGDGTTNNRNIPVNVTGLLNGVKSIAAGFHYTCALTTAGGVKCWGANGYGTLGDGTLDSHNTPTDVIGLISGVGAIAAGNSHACALTSAGGVQCWGFNIWGQLGDGTLTTATTPVDVVGMTSGVTAMDTGSEHTCAVTTAGGIKCWGNNEFGQLGDGTTWISNILVNVSGPAGGFITITTGVENTCALTAVGGVQCWGYNGDGRLGDGTNTSRSTPVNVMGLTSGVNAVAAGYYHVCALTTAGGVKCWGHNYRNQLGDGTTTDRSTPVDVDGLTSGISAITTGGEHTCALTTTGGVKCWGNNQRNQLGDGTNIARSTPVDVTGLTSGVSAISAGGEGSCALTTTGVVKCWGNGQSIPADVVGLSSGISAISGGGNHSCALTDTGGMKCWGYNGSGQLGDGTTTSRATPVDVTGLTSEVIAVDTGGGSVCAITTSGGLKCWGSNDFGQLGDGTLTNRTTPVDVPGLTSGVSFIDAGIFHSCAVTTAGEAMCWGLREDGQLGDKLLWLPGDVIGFGDHFNKKIFLSLVFKPEE